MELEVLKEDAGRRDAVKGVVSVSGGEKGLSTS
jgi:hypothetical protein